MFSKKSRYRDLPILETRDEQGRSVRYAARRFLPAPSRETGDHAVITQADRLDLVAARHLGDPELFYRICDENEVLHPDELDPRFALGKKIRIPGPREE